MQEMENASEEGDSLRFSVTMSAAALYDYLLYHAYSSPSGILGCCFGVAGLILFAVKHNTLYLIMGIILLLYLPVTLYNRTKLQMRLNPSFKSPVSYEFTPEGFSVAQGEALQSIGWEQCLKAVGTRKSILIYTGKNNASIFPREELGGSATTLIAYISRYMEPKRVKIRF